MKFTCSECKKKLTPEEVMGHKCNVGESMVVPDVVGEVIAFRSWYVQQEKDEAILVSLNDKTPWTPGQFLIARCTVHNVEEIPVKTHTCGIYAAKDREHLVAMRYNRYDLNRDVVIGEVALSGKIIPGTQGWRAQKARPVKLFVPYEKWRLVDALERTYNIPVELSNTLIVKPPAEAKG